MSHFVRRVLEGVVYAKDTTNFIANRIGVHGMMTTIHAMEALDYTVEEVDAIVGKPMVGQNQRHSERQTSLVWIRLFV